MIVKEIAVQNILTKSNLPVADFSVNPYVGCAHACRYCYASFMKRFTNHTEPWGTFVDVKYWPEIRHPERYAGKEAFLGSVTDCYQPCEAHYGRTRAFLEQMQGSGIRLSIATKSDLILRDLDLIRTFPDARVAWSINTLDESFHREMDWGVSIERRFAAMKQFYDAGVKTACFISPIFPGLTDVKAIIERAMGQCNLVWLENLNLRGDYKGKILAWIRTNHPELYGLYHELYTVGNREYWAVLDQELLEYTAERGIPYVRDDDRYCAEFGEPPVVVNYFYHELVKKSAKKLLEKQENTDWRF